MEAVDDGPATAHGWGMGTQRRIVADPAGLARGIDEGNSDRDIGPVVSKGGHLRFSFVADANPCGLEDRRIECSSPDLVQLGRIDAGEAAHHL